MTRHLKAGQRRAATLAALWGNALEWFDFAVYGYVATPLGKAFFPTDAPGMQVVAAFAVFAVGYLMRPVGSLVLGPIGDLLGRRNMLSLSIVLMGGSSLLIALLPTHAQWGPAAGLVLLLLRMLQGFSVGGEFTGSMTYATEAALPGRQGLLASLATAGGLLGFSLGSATVAVLAELLGASAMEAWGWRGPFLLGGILGPKLAKDTFWFFATVFLFIASANWFGLLPGVGSIGFGHPDANGVLHHISRPILRGADADLNMTLALAVGFFACWLVWSIKANGVGGFLSHIFVYHGEDKGILKVLLLVMFFLVGFLEVISIMIRHISLTFRLFGNIYAGESLLETMLNLGGPIFGWLVALPFYGLELMVGLIQALVFTLLTAVFTSLMCTHSEEHAHAEEGGHH
jgi:F0F1-type ATP synthase membrane subunit a